MAKAKQQELTLEERLKQALVPEDEQPYEVPGNWVWTRLKYILDVRDGTHDTPKYMEKGIPLITSKNLKGNDIDFSDVKYISLEDHIKISERSGVSDGDILMAMIGTIGNPVVVQKSQDFSIKNVALFKPLSCTKIKPKFIYYFLKSSEEYMREHASGGLQPFVSLTYLRNFPISLPPLVEQERIVDRIESLFAKLDQVKELAQNAFDTFETRKTAILHKAFTGELTAKWREKNGVGMESWEKCYWSDLANTVKDKFDPALGTSNLPYIGLEHIAKGNGIIAIGKAEDVKSLKTVFKSGDILYGKLRPYLNKHDIASFDGMCSTDILAFRTNNETTAKYLNYLMDTTPFINYAVSNSKGINLPRVSEKEITKYIVNIPSLPEQKEIIRILDNLFEKEQKAKELCDVIDKIDLMKKAILAKAFRGELGTNDPREESAVELLKECLGQSFN